jgi:hypothetical protein
MCLQMSNVLSDLLADFLEIKAFSKEVNRHERSVRRWMDLGLPYTRLGNVTYIHMPGARQWLLDRMHGHGESRRTRAVKASKPKRK